MKGETNNLDVTAAKQTTETNFTGPSILSLAARRKGIARYAALHLDCARSAWGGRYRLRSRSYCSFRNKMAPQRVNEMSRSAFAIRAFTRCISSCGTGCPSASSIK